MKLEVGKKYVCRDRKDVVDVYISWKDSKGTCGGIITRPDNTATYGLEWAEGGASLEGDRSLDIVAEYVEPTTATKHDTGKPSLALLPFEALEVVGKVLDFGAKKYAAHNWRAGFGWLRMGSAALRHIFAFLRGEDNDPESGLPHLAHAACCILFLLTFTIEKTGVDDRYKKAA